MDKKIIFISSIIALLILGSAWGFFLINKKETRAIRPQIEIIIPEEKEEIIIEEEKDKQPETILVKKEETKKKDIKKTYVCSSPEKEYEDMSLIAVGQDTSLTDQTYIPKNLQELNIASSTRTGICLIKEAKDNFESMIKQAKKDGYTIKASSGFRSYAYQETLYNNALKNSGEKTSVSTAKQGYSEHQLGTTIDLTGASIQYASASILFDKTSEAEWLEKNASDYGFVESYPQNKEDITGYMYEPWHYRYVGIENAKEIIKNGQTINQFLENK